MSLKSDDPAVRHIGAQDAFAGLGLSRKATASLIRAGVLTPKALAEIAWSDEEAGARYTGLQWRLSVDPDGRLVAKEIERARALLKAKLVQVTPEPGRPAERGEIHVQTDVAQPSRQLKPGERIYAIGDIHGRLDLLEHLLAAIRKDAEGRPPANTKVILLGDLIDRGPDSAELVERAMQYSRATDRFVVLKGNHEVTMVEAVNGDFEAAKAWLQMGGGATLLSWGVAQEMIDTGELPWIMKAARERIPEAVLAWMDALPLHHRVGDLFFVHAGIRPGVPIAEQKDKDLLWITDEFLSCETPHPVFVIHGHSANENGPELQSNRIGVDTGAYRTSRLTAVGLEGAQAWTISTS